LRAGRVSRRLLGGSHRVRRAARALRPGTGGRRGHVSKMRLAARTLSQIRQRRAIVLGYHGVAASRRRDDLSMLLVAPDRFRAQVELLLEAGFRFVTLVELARAAAGGVPPAGLAAITFDDGMRNNHEVALPILRE